MNGAPEKALTPSLSPTARVVHGRRGFHLEIGHAGGSLRTSPGVQAPRQCVRRGLRPHPVGLWLFCTLTLLAFTSPASAQSNNPTIVFSKTSSTFAENGWDSYTIKLSADPGTPEGSNSVQVTFDSVSVLKFDYDSTRLVGKYLPGPYIAFDSTNWNTPVTIVLRGIDDGKEGSPGEVTFNHYLLSPTSEQWDHVAFSVTITEATEDPPETPAPVIRPDFVFSKGSLRVTEDGQVSYTMKLTADPAEGRDPSWTYYVSVSVQAAPPNPAEVQSGSNRGTSIRVPINSTNWNTPHTITVHGLDDGDLGTNARAAKVYHRLDTDGDGNDFIQEADLPLTVTETRQVVRVDEFSPPRATLPESGVLEDGAAAQLKFWLKPSHVIPLSSQLTVIVATSDDTVAALSKTQFTFDSENWKTPQEVRVTPVDDEVDNSEDRTADITFSISRSDGGGHYKNAKLPETITFTAEDDDEKSVSLDGESSFTLNEVDGSDTYTVQLATEPTGDVKVTVASSDTGVVTAAPAEITFTDEDWDSAQTVTLTAVDNDVDETAGSTTATISHTASGADYEGVTGSTLSVTRTNDDDVKGLVSLLDHIEDAILKIDEGGTADYTLKLNSEPTENVTVSVALGQNTSADATVAPASLTFTPANWNTAQTVTVTSVRDNIDKSPGGGNVQMSASGGGYNGETAAISFSVKDVDNSGLTLSAATMSLTEGAAGKTFTAVLTSKPNRASSKIKLRSDSAIVTVAPAEITFTADNWNTVQTVTVTAVDDEVRNVGGETVTGISFTAEGYFIPSLRVPSFEVTVTEDDSQGQNHYYVQPDLDGVGTFNVEPDAASKTAKIVVFRRNKDDPNESIAITPINRSRDGYATHSTGGDWNLVETGSKPFSGLDYVIFNVTAFGDDLVEGTEYALFRVGNQDLAYPITDAETPSIEFSRRSVGLAATGEFSSDTWKVLLGAKPQHPVTVDLSVAANCISSTDCDPAQVSVSPLFRRFTPSNWDTWQYVTAASTGAFGQAEDVKHAEVVHRLRGSGFNALPAERVRVQVESKPDKVYGPVWIEGPTEVTEGETATFTFHRSNADSG